MPKTNHSFPNCPDCDAFMIVDDSVKSDTGDIYYKCPNGCVPTPKKGN